MKQFLFNIKHLLTSKNPNLILPFLIPFGIIESYLFMENFLIIFKIKSSKKQKILYVFLNIFSAFIFSSIFPPPINIIINYLLIILLIKYIFKINLFQSIISFTFSTMIFAILNILIQKFYLLYLNISLDSLLNIPIYRFTYLLIIYSLLFLINYIIKKKPKIKLSLDNLELLSKKTILNIFIITLTLFIIICSQIFIATLYIDIIPVIITISSFTLLTIILFLVILNFSRIIKLVSITNKLISVENHNKTLKIHNNQIKGFQHDIDNIVATISGYLEFDDLSGLKKYFSAIKKECQNNNNLSLLNPQIINNPGIYNLLNTKYLKSLNLGITFNIEYFIDINSININLYFLSRILGIFLDNAIEAASNSNEKIIKLNFFRENKNFRTIIIIQNSFSNKNIDIEKIFNKGFSSKQEHNGFGLWEVKKYVEKSRNLDLFTYKDNTFFTQELTIYDI